MPSVDRQTLLIVGLGLIGGSIARALAGRPDYRVLACGRDDRPLRQAQADGVIDGWSQDVSELAREADIVLVATPTRTVGRIFAALADAVEDHTIITDAASVKGSVVTEARRFFSDSMNRIVPAHPIAGSEKTGYAASFADLYRGRNVIITPDIETRANALKKVVNLWQHQGADVHLMSAERHDEILAGTSHLPHLLAFDLVNTLTESVSEPDRPWQVFDFAAGGFADFSRIASSDATMWRDIFLSNSQATVSLLEAYIAHLQRTRDTILALDGDTLHREFSQAKAVRDDFISSFQARRQRAESPSSVTTGGHAVDKEPGGAAIAQISSQLTWLSSGSVLSGEISLAASNDATLKAIETAVSGSGVTILHGTPDNRFVRDFIRRQVANGALIAGPDNGRITIYAEESVEVSEVLLPASSYLLAAVALLAVDMTAKNTTICARIVVKSALAEGESLPAALACLQSLGLLLIQRQGHDLCLVSATELPDEHSQDVLIKVIDTIQSDDEWLLVMMALLWHPFFPQRWQVKVEPRRAQALIRRFSPLGQIGIEVHQNEEAVASGEMILTLQKVSRAHDKIDIDAKGDDWLTLAVLAVTSSSVRTGQIRNPGHIRDIYPGLIDLFNRMGLEVRETRQ